MSKSNIDTYELEHTLAAFVRAFGLHQGEHTPCGVNVSVSEAQTLIELARTGGLRQGELVTFLKLEKSTVSRLVQNLAKRGWLSRESHPSDGRAQLLTLTTEGAQQATQVARARRAKFDTLTQALPESQRTAVLSALSTLTEAINEAEQIR